jgi:hypothetical protein
MKYITLILISFLLISCQGLDLDTSTDNDADTDLKFVIADLTNKILFSDELLQRDIKDGFILRIDALGSNLKEIAFINNNANEAIFGNYAWELVNDELQVSYPNSVTCTTTKIEEPDNFKFDSKVSCTSGALNNARIEGELIKPISLRFSAFSDKTITIELENGDMEVLAFDTDSDGTFTFTENGGAPQNGEFKQSAYENVVRIEYSDSNDSEYSLFILLNGSITDGTLLDLRFNGGSENKDDLNRVRIYSLSGDNWTLEEERDAISEDN